MVDGEVDEAFDLGLVGGAALVKGDPVAAADLVERLLAFVGASGR